MEIRPRTSSHTLILAAVGGLFGFITTVNVGYLVLRDVRPFYARGLITLGVLVAGVGWLLGAAGGLVLTKAAAPRTTGEAWALRAMALLFVVAGVTTPWWTQVFPSTQGLGYHVTARVPMQWSIWFDAALAPITCLALAQRRFRREAIVIGAIAAVGIVVSAMALVASGPCPLSHCEARLASGS